jgi:hypothetical protein
VTSGPDRSATAEDPDAKDDSRVGPEPSASGPSAYPEHEKLHAVVDKSQAIGEFLEWAAEEHGYRLCYLEGERYWSVGTPVQRLLAEFFDIDEAKLEEEKDAMLAALRTVRP